MNMFFWFFKQLYYCLRSIFKRSFIILFLAFVIFVFIFINKGVFAFSINNANYPDFPTEYQGKDFYMFNLTGSNNGFPAGTYAFVLDGTIHNFGTEEEPKFLQVSSEGYIHGWQTSARYETARFNVLSLVDNQWTLYRTNWGGGVGNFDTFHYIGGTMNIYNTDWTQKLYNKNFNSYTNPYITTNSNDIKNWSFDYLSINAGSYPVNGSYWLTFNYPNASSSLYEIDLSSYKTVENNTVIFNIPKSVLQENIVIRNGSSFSFSLQCRYNLQILIHELGSYTLSISQETQTETNEDSNKQILSDISNNQKETTQAVENLEDSITDPNIEDSSIFLPTDNTNDITQDGINGIFTSIYNAFCTGEAKDIVFPIPFTDKNITLSATYVQDMLESANATWILTFINAFWGYLVGRFIVKDISKKIDKIKSGDAENIENSNIKEDML